MGVYFGGELRNQIERGEVLSLVGGHTGGGKNVIAPELKIEEPQIQLPHHFADFTTVLTEVLLSPFNKQMSNKTHTEISRFISHLNNYMELWYSATETLIYHVPFKNKEGFELLLAKMKKISDGLYIYRKKLDIGFISYTTNDREKRYEVKARCYGKNSVFLLDKFNRILDKLSLEEPGAFKVYSYAHDYNNQHDNSSRKYITMDSIVSRYKESIVENINSWLVRSKFMRDSGQSVQLGFIFEGPPGSGKSTLAKAIASYLDYPTVYIDNNSSYKEQFDRIESMTVVVLEDIDLDIGTVDNDNKDRAVFKDSITLGKVKELMNYIEGYKTYDRVVFILNTNNIKALEKALIRKGRFHYTYTVGEFNESEIDNYCRKYNINPESFKKVHGTHILPADMKSIVEDFLGKRKLYLGRKKMEYMKYLKEKRKQEKGYNQTWGVER